MGCVGDEIRCTFVISLLLAVIFGERHVRKTALRGNIKRSIFGAVANADQDRLVEWQRLINAFLDDTRFEGVDESRWCTSEGKCLGLFPVFGDSPMFFASPPCPLMEEVEAVE